MDIRVVAIVQFNRAPGSVVVPGDVLVLPDRIARQFVDEGKVVYYSTFSSSQIRTPERQSRIVEAPQHAAVTEAPAPIRRPKRR